MSSASNSSSAQQGTQFSGFLFGLVPLVPLAVIVIVTVALAYLARLLTANQGFYTQQWAAVIVVALGLLGAAISHVVFCLRSFRQIRGWQQAGNTAQANGALWGLVVVSLVVLLPLLLAILIPQHPAPTLAP